MALTENFSPLVFYALQLAEAELMERKNGNHLINIGEMGHSEYSGSAGRKML